MLTGCAERWLVGVCGWGGRGCGEIVRKEGDDGWSFEGAKIGILVVRASLGENGEREFG